jgi:hypothetical protein
MEIVYLLDTMKKMSALPKEDFEATKRVTEEMKKFENFPNLINKLNAKSANFEGRPVYIASATDHCRVVFTLKDRVIYILSVINNK